MNQARFLCWSLASISILSYSTSAAPAIYNEVIPLIQLESMPLTDALRQLARKAQLNVILDPKLSAAPYSSITISVRWENVTAREALVALLDNYGLILVETPR
jgi:hypothetical protein